MKDFNEAFRFWTGKSKQLKQLLVENGLMRRDEKFNFRRAVSLYANHNFEAADFADASLMRSVTNDITMNRARARYESNDEFTPYLAAMNIATSNLNEFHHQTINVEDNELYLQAFRDRLRELLYTADIDRMNIQLVFRAELPNGDIVSEVRKLTSKVLAQLIHIIDNLGIMEEEDLGYELGLITNFAMLKSIEVIDGNQQVNARKRRAPGFFSWLIKPSPFDLSRYQIYSNFEDIDTEQCFIHSLRMKGVDESIINAISLDLADIKNVTLKTVEHIAEKYGLHINVKAVYPDKFFNNRYPRRDMYNDSCDWIELCFFTLAKESYPEHMIPYDENIKFNFNYFKASDEQKQELNKHSVDELVRYSRFNSKGPRFELKGNSIDSIKLLRELHSLQDRILIPLTNEQKCELKNKKNEIAYDSIFEINDSCLRPYTAQHPIFGSIDNLYQVGGSVESLIHRCISGLGPRISKAQHVAEALVDLDSNSAYANAGTHIKIPLGKPKRYTKDIDVFKCDAAYLLIDIKAFHKYQKYTAVQRLSKGNRFVDLITLNDLIKWHEIEYDIIDGIYYNEGSVSIASQIIEIYNKRKLAMLAGDEAESKRLKKLLNINLYGKSIQKRKATKIEYFNTFEEGLNFMCLNPNAESMIARDGTFKVTVYKRWTDSFNLAFLGCSIISTARAIINHYIYTLEHNGVEVLYSNVDSLFIRRRDLARFNELFPNSIGIELGQFSYDYDYDGTEYADEAIFIKRGCYILKFNDIQKYQIRNIANTIKNPSWENYVVALGSIANDAL